MLTTRNTIIALAMLAATVAPLVTAISCGPCPLAELDAKIWGTPEISPAPGSPPGTPATPSTPGYAPPILETVAAILAMLGFGGMARWIQITKRSTNGNVDKLRQDYVGLAADVARLERTLSPSDGN